MADFLKWQICCVSEAVNGLKRAARIEGLFRKTLKFLSLLTDLQFSSIVVSLIMRKALSRYSIYFLIVGFVRPDCLEILSKLASCPALYARNEKRRFSSGMSSMPYKLGRSLR